jgi:hypothetical protein
MSADPTTFRRGGFWENVFYTPAGDVHSVKARISGADGAGAHPVREVMEYFQGGDGTKAELRAKWSYEPTLVSEADLRVLRSWRAAGKRIGVICLGDTPASWREPVPVLLTDDGGGRGAFAGQKVVMETRRLEADVQRGPDFFAGVDLSGGAEVVLPVPGMLLRIEAPSANASVTAEARRYDGTVLATETAAPNTFLELSPGTFYVYLSGPARTEADRDGFALVLRSGGSGSTTLEALGRGVWDETTYEHTTVMGNTVTLTKAVLKPDMLGAQRIRKSNAYAGYLTIDQ